MGYLFHNHPSNQKDCMQVNEKTALGILVVMTAFALMGCQTTQDVDLLLLKKNPSCGQKCSAYFKICDDEMSMTPIAHHNSCVDTLRYCVQSCDDLGITSATLPASSEITMDQAKAKCLDLGFKVGTESFGQCVLKISK